MADGADGEQPDAAGAGALAFAEQPAIAQTLARAGERIPYAGAAFGALDDGWYRASEIIESPALVTRMLDQTMSAYGVTERQIAASFLVLGYFWYPMAAAIGCLALEQRVPNLAPEAVAMRLGGGVRFLSPRYAGLPSDPAAGDPHQDVLPDLAALRERLAHALEQHAVPLFTTLRAVAPYGVNAMRANYVDRLVGAIIHVGETLHDADFIRREVAAFVPRLQARSRAGLFELEVYGTSVPCQRRAGCCLNYRVPGLEKCDTCSLRPEHERLALVREYLRSDDAPPWYAELRAAAAAT